MAKGALTVRVGIDGARETLQALNQLPKEANEALRKRSMDLAELLARKVEAAGRGEGRQARALASTVKASRDRVPVITAGGTKRIGRNKAPAFKLLFGSEFGSARLTQFRPHRGRKGYWVFPTIEKNESEIADAWRKVVDDIVDQFGGR